MIAVGWLWALVFVGMFCSTLIALFNTDDNKESHIAQGIAIGFFGAALVVAMEAGLASLPLPK